MENYNSVKPKSGRGRLLGVVVYEWFGIQGFDWENFGVLDCRTLTKGGLY